MPPQTPDPSEPWPDGTSMPAAAVEPVPGAPRTTRRRAVIEVLLCSGFPTQLVAVAALTGGGLTPMTDGVLTPAFVFSLSAVDTVLLLGLIAYFLHGSREPAHAIFVGPRPVLAEAAAGVMLVPLLLILVVLIQLGLRALAPALHNVETNPFGALFASPALLAGFIVLVLIAGGIREEIQRAFLLHRFEQRLGGVGVGIIATSAAFGLGHTLQGWDAAVVTGLMGATWGVLYVVRRSVIGNVVSHALFNVAQVVMGYVTIARI
ncbi:MAG: CPBP family intramembrane glutamic endopeptidase [Acidobacteriota bacterium]